MTSGDYWLAIAEGRVVLVVDPAIGSSLKIRPLCCLIFSLAIRLVLSVAVMTHTPLS